MLSNLYIPISISLLNFSTDLLSTKVVNPRHQILMFYFEFFNEVGFKYGSCLITG